MHAFSDPQDHMNEEMVDRTKKKTKNNINLFIHINFVNFKDK